MAIIITVLIFGFIIVVHEWGHFIVARKSGVFVEEFAVGMGKKLWSTEKNGTMYSIRIFPLGGYCKMKDEDTTGDDKDSFSNATMFKKFAILFAGAFMNFIFAFIIFIAIAFFSVTSTTTINKVEPNSPAQQSGIQAGDKIYSIDGKKIMRFDDLSFKISRINEENNKPLEVVVVRNNEKLLFEITPQFNEEHSRYLIGISPILQNGMFSENVEGIEKKTFFGTIYDGFWNMIFTLKVTLIGVFELFTGQIGINQMMGPIGLTPVIDSQYQAAMKAGVWTTILTMLNITALLSANIGVLNLLPIPALDGGRILFLLIELIRGKPMAPEKEGMVHIIGFAILMGFGIIIAFKDIFSIF